MSKMFQGNWQKPHLLHRLTIGKDILNDHIEFSQEVFAEAVSIPACSFKQHTLYAIYRQVEGDIPFRIEVLADRRGRLLSVSKIDYQILTTESMTVGSSHHIISRPTGSLLPLLSFAARFLAYLYVSLSGTYQDD